MAKFRVPVTCIAVVKATVEIEMPDEVIDDWKGTERLDVVSSHAEDLVAANGWPVDWKIDEVMLDALKVARSEEVK